MTRPRACGPPGKLSRLCSPSSRVRKARRMVTNVALTSSEDLERAALPSRSRISVSLTEDGPALCASLELCIAKMRLQILAETPHRAVASSSRSEFLWVTISWTRYKLFMRGLHDLSALLSTLPVITGISWRGSSGVAISDLVSVWLSFWAPDIVERVRTLVSFWPP